MQMQSQTPSFECDSGLAAKDVAAAGITVVECSVDVVFGADVAFSAEEFGADADLTAEDHTAGDPIAEDPTAEDPTAEDLTAEGPFAGEALTEEDLTENKLV